MAVMTERRKKPKPVSKAWAKRLDTLQTRLALSNADMAAKFGVEERTFISWKYGERNLSKPAAMILLMLETGK